MLNRKLTIFFSDVNEFLEWTNKMMVLDISGFNCMKWNSLHEKEFIA